MLLQRQVLEEKKDKDRVERMKIEEEERILRDAAAAEVEASKIHTINESDGVYVGTLLGAKKNGKGKKNWTTAPYIGHVYEGDYKDGNRHGRGKDDKMHGRGRLKNASGVYEGDFNDGNFNGRGTNKCKGRWWCV